MKKKKKRAAPEVLRRAYGSRVRTLADTILSLLPLPLAEECRCKGRCCLICSGRPFLVRDGDTSDYRRILTQGFAVLSDDTPLIAAFSPDQRWPQHSQHHFSPIADVLTTSAWCLLLTRIGDCLMAHLLKYASIFLPLPRKNHLQVTGPPINESPRRQRSKVPEHKTFGFQSGVKSFQPSSVANHAEYGQRKKRRAEMEIDDKFMCDATVSMQQPSTSLCTDKLTGSVITDVGGKPKKRVRRFRWQRCRKRRMMDFREVNVLNDYFTSNNVKDNSSGKLEQSSNADLSYSGKRKWSCDVVTQKHALEGQQLCTTESNALKNDEAIVSVSLHRSHPREMYLEEVIFQSSGIVIDSDLIHVSPEILEVKQGAFKKSLSSGIVIDSNWISTEINLRRDAFNKSLYLEGTSANLSKGSSCDVTHSGSRIDFPQKVLPSQEFEKQCPCLVPSKKCFYCLMLQAPRNVERGAQVKRQCMFYTSSLSRSIFPRNHILNKLKPNDFGATTLMRCIFGLPDEHKGADSVPCCHDNNACPIKSECLYHSLIDSLKNLIRKARHCQYLKLLGRHCSIPTLHSCTNVEDGSTSQEREMHMKLSLFRVLTRKKTNTGLKSVSKLCLRKSYGHVNIQQEGSPLETSRLYHNQLKLSRSYCKHKQVVSFIWAACRSIIPLDLLGCSSNWRALRRNISKFVQLRRYEKISLNQCMHRLKTSFFPLLSKVRVSSSCMFNLSMKDELGKRANMFEGNKKSGDAKAFLRNKLFESWIFWLFSSLVIPIIQSNFYVTESEAGKQDIFYYRKPIWKKLMKMSISCLRKRNYRSVDLVSFRNIIRKRSFGFSKVRFLPKENGVRPLANLKAPSKILLPVQGVSSKCCSLRVDRKAGVRLQPEIPLNECKLIHFKSVNSVLRELFVVLNGIKAEHPWELGSSVFDYNDIYKKLCPFIIGLRNQSMTMPRVFIVICDVSKAFDSIDQDKLLSVMKCLIHNNEYHVKKYAQVSCTKKSLRVHYEQVCVERSSVTDIKKFAPSVPFHSSNCVLVDQVQCKQVRRGTLHHLLREHVKHNLLQLGQNLYLQEVGIPQGSVLSALLCSFYYGHLERNVIFPLLENSHELLTVGCGNCGEQDVTRCLHIHEDHVTRKSDDCYENQSSAGPTHMLLRLIDDFLFISTSKKQATSFLSMLQRGFGDYNCWMNDGKFHMNFDPEYQSEILPNTMYTGEDGVSLLPWSGLLVNCRTLEIQADYTRYWTTHMSSTLTVNSQSNPSSCLKAKLCDYMRPKCHPIFYDSNINSPAIVRLNAYQAFLLCAMKFHCYIFTMSKTGLSPNFYLEIIQRSFSYMYKLIKKRVHGMNFSSNHRPILRLRKEEVQWLGLSAYIRVLRKKQSRYVELLALLRSKVGTYRRMESNSSDLKYAVDDSHSSLFWKIKY
ncbi:telomerase reverse transcriptase [Magnolia sinica]|uniref:telomerase reverse transcriptase n=1 Tax=Magnolia sinica TaxID=86752 RepID=UPI002659B048|nr:telomerase reverse transcriptase [Magnolia sinica]XP_058075517.1 telomerase reverse transcriptase [Magnolia sinica]